MQTRRTFLINSTFGAAALVAGLDACAGRDVSQIPGTLRGPNHAAGHRLRDRAAMPAPSETLRTDVLIVGGGVAGLSARRWLHKQGVRDVLLLELEDRVGGNALEGKNAASAYAWGAHYLPIADPADTELIAFLQESELITGYQNGLPVYDEYALCHDPEERLFLHGRWQEGLLPTEGVPEADRAQLRRFMAEVDRLKNAVGRDGKPAFAIPLDRSSADPTYRNLDQISFDTYLTQHGYSSAYLRWYLAYGCRDDYGSTLTQTSAWAGLHYHAARRGRAANASPEAVLTWPEGNSFLVEKLRTQATAPIRPNTLVYALERTQPGRVSGFAPTGVAALAYDTRTHTTLRVEARQVILAIPQFVATRLLGESTLGTLAPARAALASQVRYAPWLVANLTVSDLPQARGMGLCWDNVLYGTDSVGYVVANHQHLTNDPQRVLTYYRPLCHDDPAEARRLAYAATREAWLPQVLAELETAHPGLTPHVQQADMWVWGHGMVAPSPGYIWGNARATLAAPVAEYICCAHSDLSGISIFEEAFHQGIRAAEWVVR
jgi:phytoene dehydrogenase-like protein